MKFRRYVDIEPTLKTLLHMCKINWFSKFSFQESLDIFIVALLPHLRWVKPANRVVALRLGIYLFHLDAAVEKTNFW